MLNKDLFYMKEAYKQAERAFDDNEVPIGAVIVCKDQIISRAYNQVERLNDPTAHAEMIAITSASNFLNSKYLEDCTLYVTLEPCKMCSGAISHAHIKNVVFGVRDNSENPTIDHFNKSGGILEEECQDLMDEFFRKLRD